MNGKLRNALLLIVFALIHVARAQDEGSQTLNQKGFIGRMLATMATSNMASKYNQFLSTRMPLRGVPAPDDIQQLWQEAQAALGIPADRQVPIYYDASLVDVYAAAAANQIRVGDGAYDSSISYGVRRCNMFHEATHVKYNDHSSKSILWYGGQLGTFLSLNRLIRPQGKLGLLLSIPSVVVGSYVGRAMQYPYEAYYERRADIEGHYATQCHRCVTEKALEIKDVRNYIHDAISILEAKTDRTEEQDNALKISKKWLKDKERYLSAEENDIIAADLKRGNKVCAFHKNESSS